MDMGYRSRYDVDMSRGGGAGMQDQLQAVIGASDREMISVNEIQAYNHSLTYKVDESKRKQKTCIHFMKNECKKGKHCQYMHVLDEEKVPICRFYKETGSCQKESQCIYRHPKPDEASLKKCEVCPYYERGFCKVGHSKLYNIGDCCQFSHEFPSNICQNFALGFCPLGPNCPFVHVKSLISPQDMQLMILANFPQDENWIDNKLHLQNVMPSGPRGGMIDFNKPICHRCGSEGHKSTYCQDDKIEQEQL